MKIVIAPDSFKESLTAMEVANAIEAGFRTAFPNAQIDKIPVADGGEGTVQTMIDVCNGEIINRQVTGPLNDLVDASYGMIDSNTAVIEMASSSGLHHVPNAKRNPFEATSYGTGELIKDALDEGAKKIIIGLGGSATNDGGAGMMMALGVDFFDRNKKRIHFGNQGLSHIDQIDMSQFDARLKDVNFQIACDVDNPLCGSNGASFVFAKQKGATTGMMKDLDNNLSHYAKQIEKYLGRKVENCFGAGAAGGMGAAFHAFFNAEFNSGIDIVLEALNFREKIQGANIVVTGEGKLDSQSLKGKAPIGVAKVAKESGCFVIGIAGCLSEDSAILNQHGIDAIFSILPRPMGYSEAINSGKINLIEFSKNLGLALSFKFRD